SIVVACEIAICAISIVSSSPVTGRAMTFSIKYDGGYYCTNVVEMELVHQALAAINKIVTTPAAEAEERALRRFSRCWVWRLR
ncbi:MAG: hypothetical protein Q8O29_09320, partial [Polaromonas sp.]|uniref:hypothetical protein n=1 Tax=Polaromonas sp. TaxID=1869339 RepID=UPI002737104B